MEHGYIPRDRIQEDSAFISDPDERNHLARVLRKRPGDLVRFVDGEGWIYEGVLTQIKPKIEIEILDRWRDRDDNPFDVTLAPALLKGARLDMVVEKATELGVTSIMPMQTSRTVPGVSEQGTQRRDRWRRIALSAMKQSLRSRLPNIVPITNFLDVISASSSYDLPLMAWEEEHETNITLATTRSPVMKSALLMIGPEGGFSREEIEIARQAGVQTVSLGASRLRSDTASIAGLALLIAALDII